MSYGKDNGDTAGVMAMMNLMGRISCLSSGYLVCHHSIIDGILGRLGVKCLLNYGEPKAYNCTVPLIRRGVVWGQGKHCVPEFGQPRFKSRPWQPRLCDRTGELLASEHWWPYLLNRA